MLALLFCVLLLSLWTSLGYVLMRALDVTRNKLQSVLLAPPLGVVCTVLPVFFVNRMGIPVKTLALPVTLLLIVVAGAGLWWAHRRDTAGLMRPLPQRRRRRRPWLNPYTPFAVIILVALVLSGRPMLEFGFNWLSYCNEDMANYTMAAERFLHYGFFDIPPVEALTEGRNYNQNFWFMHARDAQRPGCELIIAWAAGTTGLTVHEVFMPAIIAMHGGLVSAAAGLVYRSRRRYRVALGACALMAVSALSTFGAMYQLIAQVAGLSILTLLAALLLRPLHTVQGRHVWRYGILTGIAGAGLLVIYPESAPFLGVSLVGYQVVQIVRRRGRAPWRRVTGVVLFAAVVVAVMMQTYSVNAVLFLLDQVQTGSANTDVQVKLFPYYLLPSGLANLWNLQMIATLPLEPFLSLTILTGLIATVAVVLLGARLAWRGEATATVMVVMFVVGVQLFQGRSAFGLYKLAMFLQPFMLGVVAIVLLSRGRFAPARLAMFVALLLSTAWIQRGYVAESRGAGFTEIYEASEMRVTQKFNETIRELGPASLLLDTSSITLSKFESVYASGIPSGFPTHDYFGNIESVDLGARVRSPVIVDASARLLAAVAEKRGDAAFDLKRDPNDPELTTSDPNGLGREHENPFRYSRVGLIDGDPGQSQYLIGTGTALSVLNRFHYEPSHAEPFIVKPMATVRNHLLYKFSEFGIAYYGSLKQAERVTFYQVERDRLIPGARFIGIGRYLLFEVLQPTEQVRLVLDITATLKSDKANFLPKADAIGDTRVTLPLVGRGSARVFSPPLKPQVIKGRSYVMIDLNEFGTYFPFQRVRLMNLWGNDITFDHRKLVCFARGISVVGEDDYANLRAPRSLTTFPKDLMNQHVEYSGIYEKDGWVSDASYYMLKPEPGDKLSVRGEVPNVGNKGYSTKAVLKLDGQVLAEKMVTLGEFELIGDVPPGQGRRRVELTFEDNQYFPAPDNRPVAAKIFFVGFEPATFVPRALSAFPTDLTQQAVVYEGVSTDGWAAGIVHAILMPETDDRVAVRGVVPLVGNPDHTSTAVLKVDGVTIASKQLPVGHFEIAGQLPAGHGRRKIELSFDNTQILPVPDGRSVGAQITFMGFERQATP
ncbi:MAG TPA: hypothetical protein VGN72_19450 [Tepidisphaeraceae bacterium]|nr:hypothetical protein [Tepidisphaeraceae bacterium]